MLTTENGYSVKGVALAAVRRLRDTHGAACFVCYNTENNTLQIGHNEDEAIEIVSDDSGLPNFDYMPPVAIGELIEELEEFQDQ